MSLSVQLNGADSAVTSIFGTVGTSPVAAVPAAPTPLNPQNFTRRYLKIHNPSAAASLAYTVDGSVPVVNGNGFTVGPLGSDSYTIAVPQGVVNIIASTGATPYSILVG